MTDKIAEIRKRCAVAEENKSAIRPAGFSWTIPGWQAHNDRSYLLAEVDRLTRERNEARAEVERLWRERDRAQAKVERARVTLREIMLISRGVCGEIESGRDSSSMGDEP